MKRIISITFILVVLVFCVWLFLYQPSQTVKQNVEPHTSFQPTNIITTPPASNTPPQTALATNAFVRPDYIDEGQWNRLMLVRRLALEQNRPVEFYARVLDQNDQPVAGAKLTLKLTRIDERMFETTNFFSRKMGDEVLIIPFELFSDSNGWIRFTGTNGYFLDLCGMSKEGYSSSYPDGNFAGAHYEPSGIRTPTEDVLMTNSWNPDAGYILHLQKTEGK